ncbi:MAG: hypothetical protein IJO45_06080 [Oscillospiraceae bacterium]|nr:hypothetical protein [Oscillospiraceae bacterium]
MKKLTVKQLARIQAVFYILAAGFAIASYLTEAKGSPRPLLWAAFVFIVISFTWRLVFVKCPQCGDSLSNSKRIPDTCPNCGFDLTTLPQKENPNE